MTVIKVLVSTVCVSVIFYGAVSFLIPKSVMSKSFKYIISLALLTTVILSVKGMDLKDVSFDSVNSDYALSDFSGINEVTICAYKNAAADSVENIIAERIKNITENPFSVEVLTDISENLDISITEVVVVCNAEDSVKIKQISDELGINISIVVRDGN